MAVPILNTELKTSVADMKIGDYIAARYTTTATNIPGTFSEIGTVKIKSADSSEDEADALNLWSTSNLDGVVYLIKVAKGVLMCNMLTIPNNLSYHDLNKLDLIYGKKVTIDDRDYLMRVPTASELLYACSNMNGAQDGAANRYTNFNTSSSYYETIQGVNGSMYPCYFFWNTCPATMGGNVSYTSVSSKYARFVLAYVDNENSTDLYH